MTRILAIHSSARRDESVSRRLTEELVARLVEKADNSTVTIRDVAEGLSFPSEAWVTDRTIPQEQRTAEQNTALEQTDRLVEELRAADIIVVGAPTYNFGIPAALKAWIDHVAQPGRTFRYTEDGPVGLLSGKRVYVVNASGGVPVGSPADFVTPYLKHVFAFLGVTDVEFVAADQLMVTGDDSMRQARDAIEKAAA
ncbi:FMN-dependent NADH-azoreductase [Hoeflea prorocentri]|uniref:FMN dependent NADH:quinone oxidoreductase n=1 Tax=Hoeflea prorocentri TaxID=1922333 RepID=A0A9X3UFI9_9HYPH|nr:NAD(P)H-dependent oxidoreductase [Hoeflea prorocentri]MCY6379883.1 NAD(P)H-dependent oxidoreductase [Hoeflea prorocentri]MDA5397683.1 NAD(P)H-dependent oxidoreductase [Hoeflea prorocentri]